MRSMRFSLLLALLLLLTLQALRGHPPPPTREDLRWPSLNHHACLRGCFR